MNLSSRSWASCPKTPFTTHGRKRVNAAGPALLGALPALPALSAEQFQAEMEGENALVLDTREIEAFAGAHVGGALNIALRDPFLHLGGVDAETRAAPAARCEKHS